MSERLKKGYLQWRCRRGTKELDVVLNRFLDAKYDSLSDVELHDFDELLNTQDTFLWYWLSGQKIPEDEAVRELIFKINSEKANSEKANLEKTNLEKTSSKIINAKD